jgi:transposase-like protein
MSRPGRELTHELIDRLCALRGSGLSIAATCKAAGISTSTWSRWVDEARQFECFDRMRAAGMSFDEIEAYVMAQERERETRP